jgi:hypothetical protein
MEVELTAPVVSQAPVAARLVKGRDHPLDAHDVKMR